MADDKTADDDLWLEFMGGSLTEGGRETFSKILAKVRATAVRRVAPDRETLKAEAEKTLKPHSFRYQDRAEANRLGISEIVSSAVPYWDAVNAVADALASVPATSEGVEVPHPAGPLGFTTIIPADQVRAETLRALHKDLREADVTPWHVLDFIEARAVQLEKKSNGHT